MNRTALGRGRVAVVALIVVCAIIPAAATRVSASTSTAPDTSVSVTKTVTRANLNADGSEQPVTSKTVTVSVSQTQLLRGRQAVTVSWQGAQPTGRILGNVNSTDAPDQEYPMVVLECRDTAPYSGSGTPQVDPQTCWTHGWQSRFQDDFNTGYGPWRVDRYESATDRAGVVARPAPEPAACTEFNSDAERWVPFIGADGTTYPYGDVGCGGLPPDDYLVDSSGATPSNATFAPTQTDGTGSTQFDITTSEENASLGCSDTVACSLVVIPIMGVSCDPYGTQLPAGDTADQPPVDEVSDVASECEATGTYQPGQLASAEPADLAVSGYLWWSASNWRNRITVPLTFAPPGNVCDVVNTSSPLYVYGSELMTEASTQWAPNFCLNPKLFKFTHVQTAEPLARTLLTNGSIDAAFSAQAPSAGAGGFGKPVVQAPVAVTGFALSYVIDDAHGKPVTTLRLDARLLAKLLTESYSEEPAVAQQYPALASNPESITTDPEFIALNPGIAAQPAEPAQAALLALAGNQDVMWALTSYLNADPEARAWLNGTPDPWGMVVNPNYKSIALPVQQWPLLDSFVPTLPQNGCLTTDPVAWLPTVASPVPTLAQSAFDVQFGIDWPLVQCTTVQGADGLLYQYGSGGTQPVGQRFVIGVTTLGEAARYDLQTAQLETTATVTDPTNRFTDASGRTFVAPNTASLTAAAATLRPDQTAGTWPVNYAALRASAGAYPGTMVVYADVPTRGLTSTAAGEYAQLLQFAAGAGQQEGYGNGQLPPGYLPMTAASGLGALAAYTDQAAQAVAAQAGAVPSLEPVVASARTAPTETATTADVVPTGSSTVALPPSTRSTRSASAPAPRTSAAHPTAGPSLSGQPVIASSSTTLGIHSVLAELVFPILFALALLAGLGSAGLQLRPRPRPRPRRRRR
jgi:hypothetical protein